MSNDDDDAKDVHVEVVDDDEKLTELKMILENGTCSMAFENGRCCSLMMMMMIVRLRCRYNSLLISLWRLSLFYNDDFETKS